MQDSRIRFDNLTFFATVLEFSSNSIELPRSSLQVTPGPTSIKVKPCAFVVDDGRGTFYLVRGRGC